ncbi:MAG: hypothetical protein WBL45_03480 [Solirubrobacterales bacterium]
MVSKLKIGGLALLAVLATIAVAASAAQAGEFTASEYPATITGSQTAKHDFKFQTGTVSCAKATFHGTLEEASETLTVKADYKECKTPNGGVSVKMNSCDFLLHADETIENGRVDGSLDIQCNEEGDEIEFVEPANGCVIKVPAQEGLGTLVYTNKEMAGDFEMDISLTEMLYTQNEKCNEQGTFEDGQYLGKSTMQADEEIKTMVS